jgi:hypothetical protein
MFFLDLFLNSLINLERNEMGDKNSCIIASNICLKLNYNKTNRIDWRIFWEGERGGALFLRDFTLILREKFEGF